MLLAIVTRRRLIFGPVYFFLACTLISKNSTVCRRLCWQRQTGGRTDTKKLAEEGKKMKKVQGSLPRPIYESQGCCCVAFHEGLHEGHGPESRLALFLKLPPLVEGIQGLMF